MKKFSQQAAANFVPLLARIILFLAFVPIGWHHAMDMGNFGGDAGARLRELGIVSASDTMPSPFPGRPAPDGITLVRSPAPTPTPGPQDTPPIPIAAADAAGYQTRALHELTIAFDNLRLPKPHVWAWTVAVFELLGGAFLLIGLFSRIWAGGLLVWSIALVGLSAATLAQSWGSLWTPTDPNSAFLRATALSQYSLIVLSAGLLLTGPGKWSLDGFIFRRGGGDGGEEE
ncbi:MAG: DoxX family protein [Planctomycetaceae bacterium]|nr:DoxX family protein [Planctomycetaceae bacterium]